MTIDLRDMTADQAIDAMIRVDGLRVRADQLNPGDAIVYRRNGVYHSTTVESLAADTHTPQWVEITTESGDRWKCAPTNRGQLRVSAV